MGHYTADQWDEYMRQNFGTVGEAERWRNANNVFVDGLPPPEYTGPLSTGGFAGTPPAAQGTPNVEEDELAPQGALPMAEDALAPTPASFFQAQNALQKRLDARLSAAEANRAKNYDEETAALKARRVGPSLSEQLFALSAAIGKPTYSRSFGEILGNVTPALADMQRASREAALSRDDAAAALRRKYLLEGDTAELSGIDRLIKLQQANAPLVAAQMKSAKPPQLKSVVIENAVPYDPISGEKIVAPSDAAWGALAAAPTQQNYDNFVRTFGPRFAEKAQRIMGIATGGQ